MHNQEFLLLSADDLSQVLASDDINVPSEETVFQALITWAKQDPPGRSAHLAKLLAHIRLPLLPPQVSRIIHYNHLLNSLSIYVFSKECKLVSGEGVEFCVGVNVNLASVRVSLTSWEGSHILHCVALLSL